MDLKAIEKYRRQLDKEYKERQDILRSLPTAQWNKDVFVAVARDRGYRTESALAVTMAGYLGCTLGSAKDILQTGRMTWGQVLCLGAMLEMTPTEFCGAFLNGYFQETGLGVFRAQVEDKNELLLAPIPKPPPKPKEPEGDGWTLISEKIPQYQGTFLVTTDEGKLDVATWETRREYPPTRQFWTDAGGKEIKVIAWRKDVPKPCKRREE